ncbi:MAG: hypothetical protein ACW967_03240 [Candidatus Hodarchaeales archaeon]|jgi:hypothetical protein
MDYYKVLSVLQAFFMFIGALFLFDWGLLRYAALNFTSTLGLITFFSSVSDVYIIWAILGVLIGLLQIIKGLKVKTQS